MSRIRSLKPEFWTDRKVVGIENPWARLLFMGMWNFAMCDLGHLEDDALALKLRILPAENVDADELLTDVLKSEMVIREQLADGTSYLVIPSFGRHQKADTRWNSRCPTCSRLNPSNLPETQPSSGESAGEKVNSPQERLGEERRVKNSSSNSADAEPDPDDPGHRPDVERLCQLLLDLMASNGSRKRYITKAWRREARLLLDRDGISIGLAEHVLRWALNDPFWKSNIESMPKFREKFDQLRLKRKQEHDQATGQPSKPTRHVDARAPQNVPAPAFDPYAERSATR